MQVAYHSLALQMAVGRRSGRQKGQVPCDKGFLPPSEPFVNGRRRTESDDKDMTRKSRQGKIIERVDDLGHIKPMPALSAARLHNVFKRNIEYGFVCVFFERSLLHSLSSFLWTKRCCRYRCHTFILKILSQNFQFSEQYSTRISAHLSSRAC